MAERSSKVKKNTVGKGEIARYEKTKKEGNDDYQHYHLFHHRLLFYKQKIIY